MDRVVEQTVKNLNAHHFDAVYFDTADALKERILKELKEHDSFAFGGSTTITDLGLKDFIISKGSTYIERKSDDPEAKLASERKALTADIYFAGINGLSSDGQIVNIDMRGNRVGAITFGPGRVILITGTNKITGNLAGAIERAKNTAAVLNCRRFELSTPCTEAGECIDCEHPDNICYTTVISKRSFPHKRIAVFILKGDYGF
ncbi:MAG: lactate utilization protein [bacterium]